MAALRKRHAVIFAFPAGGHAVPLLSLSIKLAASAPDARFSFFCTAQTNKYLSPILSQTGLPNLMIHDVWEGAPLDYISRVDRAELFLKATPGNLREAMEQVVTEQGEISCVITDLFLWSARQIAEEMSVPWLAFWACRPCDVAFNLYADLIRRTIGNGPEALDRLDAPLDFIPCLSVYRVRDLPETITLGSQTWFFTDHLHPMALESTRAQAVIFNTAEFMDHTILSHWKTNIHNCMAVGPLNLLSPLPPDLDLHACTSWLDRFKHDSASVVYISFGTEKLPPPSELAALAEGLEASGAHFLWSLKENAMESLPAGFVERTNDRGMVVPWTPQSAVLGHVAVGAYVTHCGWNSVLESIAGTVPMICRPLWADNMINCRMVTHLWRIGVEVDGRVLTKDGVARAIELVLTRDEGKEMRENVKKLKERAMHAVKEGGSSFEDFNQLLKIIKGQQ